MIRILACEQRKLKFTWFKQNGVKFISYITDKFRNSSDFRNSWIRIYTVWQDFFLSLLFSWDIISLFSISTWWQEIRIYHSKIYHSGVRIILSQRQLRTSRQRMNSLPSPSLPEKQIINSPYEGVPHRPLFPSQEGDNNLPAGAEKDPTQTLPLCPHLSLVPPYICLLIVCCP